MVSDTNPGETVSKEVGYELKKTGMSFFTALRLSGKNIATKKWRTALTAFAASIGIIGIALILSLSSGFREKVDDFQDDALAEFPVMIAPRTMKMDAESMKEMRGEMSSLMTVSSSTPMQRRSSPTIRPSEPSPTSTSSPRSTWTTSRR